MDHLTSLDNQQEEYARISQQDLSVTKSNCKELSNKLKQIAINVKNNIKSNQYESNPSTESLKELRNQNNDLTLNERNLNVDIQNQRKVVDKLKQDHAKLLRDKSELQSRKQEMCDFINILNSYEKHLQISITVNKVVDNEHSVVVRFKNYESMPVKIVTNIEDNKIISVDLSKLKKSEDREELEKWVNFNKKIIPFIIKLRKCIVVD